MALTSQPRRRWPSRLHFLVRFLGLTGLAAAGVGIALALLEQMLPAWDSSRSAWENVRAITSAAGATIQDNVHGILADLPGDTFTRAIVGLVVVGGAFALFDLLIEVLIMLRLVAGRRSAFGTNVVVQVALAVALLVGINVYSFSKYRRFDWTRDKQFTLKESIQDGLRNLKGETTIVVYQRHKTVGWLAEKPDRYDYAAERKVVEKVKDLVDQFREFGPQFKVVVLDVEQEDFDSQLARLPEPVRQAIDQAPENSIIFHANGKVQRLGFNDFYQLDKTASREAGDGRGNLVLRYQGPELFARKVLNLDERRPRVVVGVIHEVLSQEGGSEEIGLAGVKKTLTANGFETRDLLLKKWNEFGPPEPAVFTFEENKLAQLDETIKELEEGLKARDEELKALDKVLTQWKSATLDELAKTDLAKDLGLERVTESLRKQVLERVLEPNIALRQFVNEQERKELEAVRKEREGVARAEETLAERRRITDLRAKTARVLADADLLVLPRMTLFNVARGERIPNRVYRLDPAQVEAIRDFVRSGKPLLVCLGPINDPPGQPDFEGGPDALEEMLGQLGLKLSRQTVLFNVESKSFAQRRSGLVIMGANVDVPVLRFDWEPGAGRPTVRAIQGGPTAANPLRESLRLTARGLGRPDALELRLRHPRPVYYDPTRPRLAWSLLSWAASTDAGPLAGLSWGGLFLFSRPSPAAEFDPEFLMTDAESWNEEQPFPTRERTPRYEPPKPGDTVTDPYEKKRLGPFPVGVAAEVTHWDSTESLEPTVSRVAAIGHGGAFMGQVLSPAREKLLLDVSNWLLGRDDRLTSAGQEWRYPRLALGLREQSLWHWGTQLGLPALFAYLGLVVVMRRRLR